MIKQKGCSLKLSGYTDVDWAVDDDDCKSTSGDCFYIDSILISWFCKKHNSISLSTEEAEYISTGVCFAQLLWMRQLLSDYGVSIGII